MSTALDELLGMLQSHDANTRFSGVSQMALLGQEAGAQAVEPLRKLLRDADRDVRGAAASALGLVGANAESALNDLISLTKAPEEEIRVAAIGALRRIAPEGDRILGALTTALRDPDADVRQAAAQSLGWLGPRAVRAVSALSKRANDPDTGVRRSVVWAMGKVGPLGFEATPVLIEALKDPVRDIRLFAAAGLGRIGEDAVQGVAPLLECLKDTDPDVVKGAVWALGRIRQTTPEVINALVEFIGHPDSALIMMVTTALRHMGTTAKAAMPNLIARLKDEDDSVVFAVMDAMEAIEPGSVEKQGMTPRPSSLAPSLRTGIPVESRQKNILIADDSIFVRRLLKEMLEEDGYTVIAEAEDGQQAVALFKQHRPDLTLMDIQMPALSGVDATKAILEEDPGAVVVVCSAIAGSKLIRQSLAAGVSYFIAKPFNKETVLNTVAMALNLTREP